LRLLQGYTAPQDLLGEEGLLKELKKRLLERALGAELSEHLGYEKAIRPARQWQQSQRLNQSSEAADG
jgi:putative transposase